jgi:pre-mRNA-processing factor 19
MQANFIGTVYEKRLIEAYISENGTEPATGEDLTSEDLIELKTARIVRPRPPQHTSVPALLGIFQEEWDALALEAYTLKENLVKTRQELSTALYENEGAVRLIAKYKKERDEARDALAKVSVSSRSSAGDGDAMQVDSAPLPSSIIAKVDATQAELSKTRRKRPVPEEWANSEEISRYTATSTSEPLYPGGNTLAVHDDLALVGGADGIAGVYSVSNNKVVQALKGGGGAITDGLWAGSKAVISTASGKVKVFEAQQEIASFSVHAGEAAALALHPSSDVLASVGIDKSYVLYDLEANQVLTQVYSNSGWSTTVLLIRAY